MKFGTVSIHTIPSSKCELRENRCIKNHDLLNDVGHPVAQSVEALRYLPEGRGFDSRWCRNFHWHNTTGRTMALRLTQPVTEIITRNISGGVKVAGA
jgi:hypothetical protein